MLRVTRWQGHVLLSVTKHLTGCRSLTRVTWLGMQPMHPWVAAERERVLRSVA